MMGTLIAQLPALEELELGWVQAGDEGVVALSSALEGCEVLRGLNVCGNRIGVEGARALAGAVERGLPRLGKLDVSGNALGADGAGALAEALGARGGLEEVAMSWNMVGDAGVTALAAALPRCSALRRLDVAWNKVGEEGARKLCEVLQELQIQAAKAAVGPGCQCQRRWGRNSSASGAGLRLEVNLVGNERMGAEGEVLCAAFPSVVVVCEARGAACARLPAPPR